LRNSMFASRAAGVVLLLIGLGLMTLALLADTLGLGGGRGFGYQQMIVFITGMVAVLLAGAILLQNHIAQNGDTGYQDGSDHDAPLR
jgi:low affinity Fe/Cu permease